MARLISHPQHAIKPSLSRKAVLVGVFYFMGIIMSKITQEYLHELFNYKDGVLYWKVARQRIIVGDIAGTLRLDGYQYIGIDGKTYKRSRLVFCMHHGYFPELLVDHINRIKNDDKIGNMREISQQCNIRNCDNYKTNTSSIKGTGWNKQEQKWLAYVTVNSKFKYLGKYKSFCDAVCARLAAEQCLNWGGCDSSSPAYQYVQKMLGKL